MDISSDAITKGLLNYMNQLTTHACGVSATLESIGNYILIQLLAQTQMEAFLKIISFDNIGIFNKNIFAYFILSLTLFFGTAFILELILRNHPSYVINYINDLAHKKEVLPNLHTYELLMSKKKNLGCLLTILLITSMISSTINIFQVVFESIIISSVKTSKFSCTIIIILSLIQILSIILIFK